MNRRDRRRMSKKLGILQYQQKLSRSKKFELMSENILAGKKLQEETKEKNRINQNSGIEELESQQVFSIAENIAKRKGITVIDALPEAQKEYDSQKK